MGHFAKLGGLAGLAALLAATSPASAGFRHGGYIHHHRQIGGAVVRGYGPAYAPPGYAPRWGGPGYAYGYGYGPGYDGGIAVEAPIEPQPYPLGYDGRSYAATGQGVVYNIPPTPPMWRPGPHIIYIHEGRHRHRHFCARRHGMAFLRGGRWSAE